MKLLGVFSALTSFVCVLGNVHKVQQATAVVAPAQYYIPVKGHSKNHGKKHMAYSPPSNVGHEYIRNQPSEYLLRKDAKYLKTDKKFLDVPATDYSKCAPGHPLVPLTGIKVEPALPAQLPVGPAAAIARPATPPVTWATNKPVTVLPGSSCGCNKKH